MNADDIERVRKIVDRDGWNIIWIGAKMPCEFFDCFQIFNPQNIVRIS